MIIFHACWDSVLKKLHLWAESSANYNSVNLNRAGGFRHPFACGNALLAEYARKVWDREVLEQAVSTLESIELPSSSRGPSSSFIKETTQPLNLFLKKWQIPVLNFERETAFRVLSNLPSQKNPEFQMGGDICFWNAMLDWVFYKGAGGFFTPCIDKEKAEAYWKPVDSPEEELFLAQALRIMPLSGFVRTSSAAKEQALQNFVSEMLDVYLRGGPWRETALVKIETNSRAHNEQWARALFQASGAVENMSLNEMDKLKKSLDLWHKGEARISGMRPSIILCEPEEGENWKVKIEFPDKLASDNSVLSELARAVSTAPFLKKGFLEGWQKKITISNLEAFEFMEKQASLLKASGFDVQLPGGWPKYPEPLFLNIKIQAASQKEKKSYFDFDWNASIGGIGLSPEDFTRAVMEKNPLVKMAGKRGILPLEEAGRALDYFRSLETGLPARDVLRMMTSEGAWFPDFHVRIEENARACTGIKKMLLNKPALIKASPGLKGELRPYQKYGCSWLTAVTSEGFGACLADDMGLGKTLQIIVWLLGLKQKKADAKSLIICPMSIVGNWAREFSRFSPGLRIRIHHGIGRAEGENLKRQIEEADALLTTYSLAVRDQQEFSPFEWDALILDEAQNIKNPEARQTQAVKSFRAGCRIALTGTPVENRVRDLWSIMDFLNPGYLGSLEGFRERFESRIDQDSSRKNLLKKVISPLILRRLKTDPGVAPDLPAKMEMKVYCSLTLEQAALYQAELQASLKKISAVAEPGSRRMEILSALVRLKQICNHPVHYLKDGSLLTGRSGKLERLLEMSEELISEGDKALVFTQFAEMGGLLKKYLEEELGREILFFQGADSLAERERKVELFQKETGPPVMVLSLKAGGSGLNLTRANHVFHFDRWWNPAVEAQASDRAYRIGQTKNVQIHSLICAGTLEEKIDRILEDKKNLAQDLLPAAEEKIAAMSNQELEEFLFMDPEAAAQ